MEKIIYSGIQATVRTFSYDEVISFCEVRKQWGGFSNMSGEYPIIYKGVRYPSSEHLYLAGRFADHLAVIAAIIDHTNAMYCKRRFRGHLWNGYVRPDWGEFFLQWMRFVLNLKYEQHPAFRRMLQQTEGRIILEDSTMHTGTDPLGGHSSFFWGAKDLTRRKAITAERRHLSREGKLAGWSQSHIKSAGRQLRDKITDSIRGEFIGVNMLGLLLTELRDKGHLDCKLPEDLILPDRQAIDQISAI